MEEEKENEISLLTEMIEHLDEQDMLTEFEESWLERAGIMVNKLQDEVDKA